MKRALAVLLALAWAAPASAAVTAAPMHASGEAPKLPRLVRFPDAKVRAQVNAWLARREAEERKARIDCREQVREQHLDASFYEYRDDVQVTYLSPHYMTVRFRTNSSCGGAYPNAGTDAVTFDLSTGAPLAWERVFGAGYKEALRKLYQGRYPKDGNSDPDCQKIVRENFADDLSFWLDRKEGGLVVAPIFAHVVQACGDEIAFGAEALAPLGADPRFLADLKTP